MEIAETGSGGGLALARAADTARQYAAPTWPLPVSGGAKLGGCLVLMHSFTVVAEVSRGEARPGPGLGLLIPERLWPVLAAGLGWTVPAATAMTTRLPIGGRRRNTGAPLVRHTAASFNRYFAFSLGDRPAVGDLSVQHFFYLIEFWKSILWVHFCRMPGCLNHTANTSSIITTIN